MDFVFAIFGVFFLKYKVCELILPAYVVQEVTKEAKKKRYELMVFLSRNVSVAHTSPTIEDKTKSFDEIEKCSRISLSNKIATSTGNFVF